MEKAIYDKIFVEKFTFIGLSTIKMNSYAWIKLNLVMISLMVMGSAVAFWALNVTPLLNFVFRLREYTRYPVDIFDPFFKFIFSKV
ncbi:MAG: ABC-2 family transporter protein [Dictyoglomaceae bacterium]